MMEITQHVEVIIRNLVHNQLQSGRQEKEPPWYMDSALSLNDRTFSELATAVRRAGGPHADQGKVVAEISFGTWRYLLSNRYRNLVWAKVAPAMKDIPRRQRDISRFNTSFSYLNRIRNRCAHCEPVYDLDGDEFIRHVAFIARHVSARAETWLVTLWTELEGGSPFSAR
jgi:hypothetical protein